MKLLLIIVNLVLVPFLSAAQKNCPDSISCDSTSLTITYPIDVTDRDSVAAKLSNQWQPLVIDSIIGNTIYLQKPVGLSCSDTFFNVKTFSKGKLKSSCTQLTVLPIELIYFEADGTTLRWGTASELNSDYFEIQHTFGEVWETVDVVKSHGNSNYRRDYSLRVFPTPGVNYYRLVNVDFDGSTQYSDIIYIRVRTDRKTENPWYRQWDILGRRISD